MTRTTRAESGAHAQKPKKLSRSLATIISIAMGVGVLVLWEIASRLALVDPIVLPAPTKTLEALYKILTSSYIAKDFLVTLVETLVGFVIGSLLGFIGGVLTGTFEFFRRTMYPYIVAFQAIPKITLAPLFLTWFGFGLTSKIVMAVVISFFPVLINTAAGIQSVGQDERMLMRSYLANRRQIFMKLTLPGALPYSFAGLKTSLSFALIGAIVGEFVGARDGLGVLVVTFNHQIRIDYVLAVIIILSLTGLALFQIIEWVDRKVIFWREDGGMH